jgi:hypothetical protein
MYGRSFFFGILIILFGLPSFAGLLEILSKTASVATLNTCSSYDKTKAQKEIISAANHAVCDNNGSNPATLKEQFSELKKILRGDPEDQYFALLADQQIKELRCAGNYANQIANAKDDDQIIKETVAKLQLARTAKHNLSRASQQLATSPNVSTRVCPTDYESLQKEFPKEERDSESYRLCDEIIVNRQAYNAIVSSIGLSGTTSVGNLIDQFANESVQVPLKESESALIKRIKAAYVGANKDLDKNATLMNKTLQEQGGAGFDRTDRYALLQDPALSKTVLARTGAEDLKGIACQADARYGHGADQLDKFILSGSLILSGAAAITVKAGTAASRAVMATNAARSTELTSFSGMRILQYSAFAADFYTAAKITDHACSDHVISEFKTQSACVSAPSLERNKQDNCILMATLSATGFAAMVPKELLLKAGMAIVGDGFKTQNTTSAMLRDLKKAPGKVKMEDIIRALDDGGPMGVGAVYKSSPRPSALMPAGQAKAEAGLAKATKLNSERQTYSDRLREARATGEKTKLKTIEDDATKSLKDGEIVHSQEAGGGNFDAQFVTYADGTQGVWKPDDFLLHTANRETAAYDIDQYLGMDLVPITVKKSFNGVPGSVQLRITSLKEGTGVWRPDELGFLDYLIRNSDRHAGNYLREPDGKLVAIDNGLALGPGGDEAKIGFIKFKENVKQLQEVSQKRAQLEAKASSNGATDSELKNLKLKASQIQSEINMFMPGKAVVERLRQTSKSDWKQLVGNRLSRGQIADLVDRQKELLNAIDQAEKTIGTARLYPAGNFSPLLNKEILQQREMRQNMPSNDDLTTKAGIEFRKPQPMTPINGELFKMHKEALDKLRQTPFPGN